MVNVGISKLPNICPTLHIKILEEMGISTMALVHDHPLQYMENVGSLDPNTMSPKLYFC